MKKHEDALMGDETFDFDLEEMQQMLSQELVDSFSDLQILEKEREKTSNPDALGEVIQSAVWEQFMNQIAVTAGEDFIKENNDLTLDLRKDAHIQTIENFAEGKVATHNTKIDYQERYDGWQSNLVKDKDGNVVTHATRTEKREPILVKGARKPNISHFICKQNDYVASNSLVEKLRIVLEKELKEKDEHFANGRLIRNIFDDITMNQSKRLLNSETDMTTDTLMLLIAEDLQADEVHVAVTKES